MYLRGSGLGRGNNMASTLKGSVVARIQAALAKAAGAQANKVAKQVTQVQALNLVGIEFVQSGKTTLITLNGVKVGVINGGGLQACAQTQQGIGYVKVTAQEFGQYVTALQAQNNTK